MSSKQTTTTDGGQETFESLLFPGRSALRVAEVAERLQLSERHVHDLIDEGKLAALDLGGQHAGGRRRIRIPIEAYEALLRARRV